ncbi:probable lysophospholipase BODYGUARD 4 [Andrographis paniculata]|uniref:probable lysophospholipase BODYGUARD 4 n=1 Tax=Andrographis paniculata TaxID=175694 RepID=UPI0021E8FFFA|nr:probable lysophospholipase BODYGUARD 4 [Andrographis paniculata]
MAAPLSCRRFLTIVSKSSVSLISAIVFAFLDALDAVMCLFFRVLDELLEGESSPCYCSAARKGDRVEKEMSESLFGRGNMIRDLVGRIGGGNWGFGFGFGGVGKLGKIRWSDCGCSSCVSWMRINGEDDDDDDDDDEYRLHLVVQQPERAMQENDSGDAANVQNVIFIHGFLSSSTIWKETVFPNLSELSRQSYRLFAVDLLGFGRSPKPRNCLYTLNDHLEMIEKSVILPYRMKSFHVVAHSMGCVIALALAAKYSASVKSVTLIAPPYFSSSKGNASFEALRQLAPRRVWPPLLFGSAFMTWYEHLGRCVCFFICRNHRLWEWLLKRLTRTRELHFLITDLALHTHHSAWHTMHNVICGGAKMQDEYLKAIINGGGVRVHVIHGTNDRVVPVECSYNMKVTAPAIELEIVPNADHNSVIMGRGKELTKRLEGLWASTL